MREALFIFRKDVRHLRLQLAAFVALLALLAWAEARTPREPAWATVGLISQWMLVPLAWFLIALDVQEQRLPGDRQYWLTRPYPRGSLLLAKALFAAAFLNLPLLAMEVIALAANGLAPAAYWPALAARQVFFTALLVLPAVALATVTAGLGQFAMGVLGAFGVVLMLELGGGHLPAAWGGMEWIEASAVAALALAVFGAVVLAQYTRRRTLLAAPLFAAGVVACALLPALDLWSAAFPLQRRFGGAWPVQLKFETWRDPQAAPAAWPGQPAPDLSAVALPMRLEGIPDGMAVLPERTAIAIEAGGQRWRSGWWPPSFAEQRGLRGNGSAWQFLAVDSEFFERIRNQPAHVRLRAAFTLFDAPRDARLPMPSQNRWVADVGFCWASPAHFTCFTPFAHAAWVEAEGHSPAPGSAEPIPLRAAISYAPYPAGAGFGLWKTDLDMPWPYEKHWSEIRIRTRRAVAHGELDLDIPDIRLARYAGPAGGNP